MKSCSTDLKRLNLCTGKLLYLRIKFYPVKIWIGTHWTLSNWHWRHKVAFGFFSPWCVRGDDQNSDPITIERCNTRCHWRLHCAFWLELTFTPPPQPPAPRQPIPCLCLNVEIGCCYRMETAAASNLWCEMAPPTIHLFVSPAHPSLLPHSCRPALPLTLSCLAHIFTFSFYFPFRWRWPRHRFFFFFLFFFFLKAGRSEGAAHQTVAFVISPLLQPQIKRGRILCTFPFFFFLQGGDGGSWWLLSSFRASPLLLLSTDILSRPAFLTPFPSLSPRALSC